jgi:DNA-binding FrmR family transcriptional regulator
MAAAKHVHELTEKRSLAIRLRKVIGQLKSVEALKSFAEVVIHQHAHECIGRAADPREGQRKLRELLTVLERYVE